MQSLDTPDLKSADFLADRYPTYRRLQKDFPLFDIEINGESCKVLTRYRDVDEVLRNPLATVQQAPGVFPERIGKGAASRFYRESLPNIDAPDHTRIRRIVTPAFNPKTVANMRGWVEKVIVDHLDRLAGAGEIDFVSAFADPVPAEIACRLLHVPVSDAAELFARQHGLNAVLSVADITPERLAEADASAAFYYEYMDDVLDALKGKLPEDDFVGALMAAEDADNGLTRSELVTTLIGFLVASYHTTKVAMSNAVLAFLNHDDERARLVAQPDLARTAWEESLRYDAPVHFVHRYASEAFVVGGSEVKKGHRLLLGLHAASRDEARFPHADRFVIDRSDNRHLAFAGGGHFCLGSQLSRLEGDVLLRTIFQRFPRMRLTETRLDRVPDLTFPMLLRMTVDLRGSEG
ncbi:Cytochrome P450 107B1 [Achromobacter xylosoxidans]|uniref:cytochrome P450 n=1 Tax=Alcaligenes xylosoxydans xylosoxydans TaxID=85698 RepID=UPI0006BEDBEF|nr:cytochrome P450 [Achromobacter xylosoxidans]CUJ77714.1 Cytochrome P450 107B1 [Achromobacter xylosoxidans]